MSAQSDDVQERITQQIKENPVILYMKGTPQLPMCGFSMRTVEAVSYTHLTLPTILLV